MKKISLFVVIFTLLFFYPRESFAQELHLGIDPTTIQIDAEPPSNVRTPFVISNLSSSSTSLEIRMIPFEAQEDGKVNLLVGEEDELDSFVRERVTILSEDSAVQNIELRAGENRELTFFMDLNEGDPAGEYYFSLVFLAEENELEETNTSSIPAGIATNIMISVGPEEDPEGHIEEFSTPSFLSNGPVPFNLKLNNQGNHLIRSKGEIIITNLWGKEVGKIDILPQYVLSRSSRYLIDSKQASPSAEVESMLSEINSDNPISVWSEEFLMGPYTAEASIILDDDSGKKVTSKTTFFALPIQVFVIITGIVFVILGIGVRMRSKIRSRKSEK